MDTQHAPQRFGRYVLLDRMGAGGMAEVFRAVVPGAEGFRRDLVVKRILSDRSRAANFIEMFVHEARISALLHHPNVVQVFDFGQVDGSYFLAMELLRGRDLLAVFRSLRERQRPFPIPLATHVAHQVALGLGYAHALSSPDGQPLNIIHRDVSPSNIMLLRTGGVKLLDFGIAQAIGEMESEESERSSFKGKLCYMAPERLRDEPQDGRVDLFALGAVLWEMLAGRRLFHGKTDVDKLRSVLDRTIPPPSSLRQDVPASLDRIVLKALARDPNQRYATGQALADDLEDVVAETHYHSRMLPAFMSELFGTAPSSAHLALSMVSPELLICEPMITPPSTPALGPRSQVLGSSPSATGRPGGIGVAADAAVYARPPALVARARSRWAALSARTKVAVGMATVALMGGVVSLALGPNSAGHRGASARAVSALAVSSSAASSVASSAPVGVGSGAPAGNASAKNAGAKAPPPLAVAAGTVTADTTAPEIDTAAGALPVRPAAAGAAAESATAASASRVRHAVKTRPAAAKPATKISAGRISRGLSIDPFAEAATRGPKR